MKSTKIALLFNLQTAYCRRAVQGIVTFGSQHNWVIEPFPATQAALDQVLTWDPAGIIAHVLDAEMATALEEFANPVVSISSSIPDLSFPVVDSDHREVGRLAADYFWGLGARNFAFFGAAEAGYSRDRERSYTEFLAERDQTVFTHHSDYTIRPPFQPDIEKAHRKVSRWLKSLPKPVAMFCSDDEHARQLSVLCQLAKIDVPGEIAILGVDDDESICLLSTPSVSSIDNPAEEIGFRAAKTLRTMLKEPGSRPPDKFVHSLRVVERGSTDKLSVADPVLGNAIRFISENAKDPDLCVDQVAAASGSSRRSLERRFSSQLLMSILTAIQRVRVSHAKALLRKTNLSVEQISGESGFSDYRRLGLIFRAHTGMSPTEFRSFYEFDKLHPVG